MRRRLLPKNVTSFKDRHGKVRYRYRRAGQPTRYFQHEPGTNDFLAELRTFETGDPIRPAAERTVPGTLSDLCRRYYLSQDFKGQGPTTRMKNRGIIEAFRGQHGDKTVANIRFDHIDAILATKAETHPSAARNLRKQLRRLFAHAVKCEMTRANPVELTARVKTPKGGHHTWTEEEIAQYQARHAIGTKARLAMELMLWTGNRRGDATDIGRQHIRGGKFHFVQAKGSKPMRLPVAPQLREAIGAMPASGQLTFLVTDYGQPFSKAGFGNRFRKWCDEAGLHHCSAHGLRKAISRRMAEMGAGNQGIKSITGHSGDAEVALYTREVDQERLAEATMRGLVDWELANREGPFWLTDAEAAEN